jgi:hypothetical protein
MDNNFCYIFFVTIQLRQYKQAIYKDFTKFLINWLKKNKSQ